MPAQKTFRSIRVRGLAKFEGPVDGISAGGDNTKQLVALISQSATDAPTFTTILRNDLGGVPAWAYTSPGIYTLTLAGAFPAGKVFTFVHRANVSSQFRLYQADRIDDDTLQITCISRGGIFSDIAADAVPLVVVIYP